LPAASVNGSRFGHGHGSDLHYDCDSHTVAYDEADETIQTMTNLSWMNYLSCPNTTHCCYCCRSMSYFHSKSHCHFHFQKTTTKIGA
jgi:hypothetical protein